MRKVPDQKAIVRDALHHAFVTSRNCIDVFERLSRPRRNTARRAASHLEYKRRELIKMHDCFEHRHGDGDRPPT